MACGVARLPAYKPAILLENIACHSEPVIIETGVSETAQIWLALDVATWQRPEKLREPRKPMRTLLLLLAALASPCDALALKLKYFDARGAAEVSRVLLALGGLDYTDHRYAIKKTEKGFETPEFTADKESGALAPNLNRAPLLIVDGRPFGQSKAMERYIASHCGLMGSSALDYAIIDSIAEHVRDVKDAQGRKGFGMFNRDKTDEEKAALKAEWFETDLPSWLERMEACVAPVEALVCGETPSYAAVCIWSLLRDGGAENQELVDKAAAGCDRLNAIADAVAKHPAVSEWVGKRPVTMM